MGPVKSNTWESLFGKNQDYTDDKRGNSPYLNPKEMVGSVLPPIEGLRNSFGEQVFCLIKEYQGLLKDKKIPTRTKANYQKTLQFMIRVAKADVKKLEEFQSLAIETLYNFHQSSDVMSMSAIISRVDELTRIQANHLKDLNLPVLVKTSKGIEEEWFNDFYKFTIKSIKEKNYIQALLRLTGNYKSYTEQQTKHLIDVAHHAVKDRPDIATDFIELVELRLLTKQDTRTIDYYALKENCFMQDPVFIENVGDIAAMCSFKNYAMKYNDFFWEGTLKENYSKLLTEIDSLVYAIAKRYPKNYLPMFMKYFRVED